MFVFSVNLMAKFAIFKIKIRNLFAYLPKQFGPKTKLNINLKA